MRCMPPEAVGNGCWGFLKRVFTGYSGLMRTNANSYRNRFIALLQNAQSNCKYVGDIVFVLARTATAYVSMKPAVTRSGMIASLSE